MLACPDCARPFDSGRCSCRRDWTETGGVPDLYAPRPEAGEDPAVTSKLRAWFEEHPGEPWRPEEDADSLDAWGAAHPLLSVLDKELPPRARVLDVGCGVGRAACHLGRMGREVLGIDLAMAGLLRGEAFRRRAELPSVAFARASPYAPPVSRGGVDVVLFLGALEACARPEAALAAAAVTLAPGGVVVLQVATPWGPAPAPDTRPPLWSGQLPEGVLGWLADAGLTLVNSDPPLAPFGRPRPLLGDGASGGTLARWAHQLRWSLTGGPGAVVYVARRAG